MSTPDAVLLALRKKAGYEAVSKTEAPNQLRILGRVPGDPQGVNMNNWKIVMYRLLHLMKNKPWKVDFSKSYFIKDETDRLVFAWRVLFQGENIAQHLSDIVDAIGSTPQSARRELTEIALPGARTDRNSTAGGRRGAGFTGKSLVGPLAVSAKMSGG